MTFESMQLIPQLLTSVKNSGYTEPTPIQAATIPLVLAGNDVLGCAQTGTGKTAAFALPILQRLSARPPRPGQKRSIRALILTPTRELAQQIQDNFVLYGKQLALFSCVVFGGVNQGAQVNALRRGADIVVACPGRLMDLMGQGFVDLQHVETFVLDEADRMLDMGFIHDVRRIAEKLPVKHQTLLFSATMPAEVESLAMSLLDHPETVKVDPVSSPVEAIDQTLYYVDKANKKLLLASLLRQPEMENALVFSRTRHGADRIVRELSQAGITASAIHGDKSQNARQAALDGFKRGDLKVLVATDIAARGIDIAGLSHVFNYDLPNEPEAYIHRIGRTGRAGKNGRAISFCCIDELKQLGQIEKLIKRRLPVAESEWPMEVMTPSEPKPRGARPVKVDRQGNAMPAKVDRQGNAVPARGQNQRGQRPAPKQAPRPMAKPVVTAAPAAHVDRAPARPVRTPAADAPRTDRGRAPRSGRTNWSDHQSGPEARLVQSGTTSGSTAGRMRFGPAAVEPESRPAQNRGQAVTIGRDGRMKPAASAPRSVAPTAPVRRVSRERAGHGQPHGKRG